MRLHGRAARRADQLGMERVAVSISHEREYAVAIAYGVRTAGGRYVLPPDIDDRLDEREAALLRPDRSGCARSPREAAALEAPAATGPAAEEARDG